ncbi:MAG TPA: thioredoxin family protein [Syntrophobacteraceae bacterium]|nr:thioredoxin family protein [Syntrophobacteraceae bacterium]
MKPKRLSPVVLLLFIFAVEVCLSAPADVGFCQDNPHIVTRDGEDLLVGRISREELITDNLLFSLNAEEYVPAAKVLEKLRRITVQTDILLFLGTWSEDCLMEAPKLLRVYDKTNNPAFALAVYALDRSLRDEEGVAARYGIRELPTVVLVRGGKEVGRIEGAARRSMEADLLSILESSR